MANHISIHCRRCAVTAMALAVLLCPLPQDIVAAPQYGNFHVSFGGFGGSDCPDKGNSVQIAGSEAELVLEISDRMGNESYRGLPAGPPEGLVWEAFLRTNNPNEAIPSDRLLARLHPQFFIGREQPRIDSIARQGVQLDRYSKRPRYHFRVTLPSELAGQILCVRAAIEDPQYGHLEAGDCCELVAPCSDRDRQNMLGSAIYMAAVSQDYSRAVAITDSLLATGWRSWLALMEARLAASALVDYDHALQYLDVLYETYGRVTGDGPKNPAREAQEYQRIRDRILERRNQQQQR